MTDNIRNNQHVDPRKQERLKWQAAVAIPAYGVLRIDTVTNDLFSAVKPDGAVGLYYVNDHVAVAANGYGSSLEWVRAQPVLFEPSAVVSVGDACGPVDGQWYMSGDETGWNVFIPPNGDDIAFVVKAGGSGSGGGAWVRGVASNSDCATATMDVTAVAFSLGCEDIPEIYGGVITGVEDPYGIMAAFNTEAEIDGATVRIEYMYPVASCMTGQWELTIIASTSGC